MPVRATSKAAFLSIRESGKRNTIKSQIYQFVVDNPGCSRNDIERAGYRISTVSGRINDLMKEGLVVHRDCKTDPISEESVNRLYAVTEEDLVA